MALIEVVCGIIFKDDNVLICRRSPNKSLGGFWEFPGGKIEVGESHSETLERELKEELGMSVVVGNHIKSVVHDYGNFQIKLHAYESRYLSATFNLVDHDAYEWCEITCLHDYKLAPADIPIAESLVMQKA